MNDISPIKPKSSADWESKVERMNYQLFLEQLKEPNKKSVDLLYIGPDHDSYSGVIFTIKGSE
ncbi:hypothetical protein D3C79_934450 [compost metagenome]